MLSRKFKINGSSDETIAYQIINFSGILCYVTQRQNTWSSTCFDQRQLHTDGGKTQSIFIWWWYIPGNLK